MLVWKTVEDWTELNRKLYWPISRKQVRGNGRWKTMRMRRCQLWKFLDLKLRSTVSQDIATTGDMFCFK